MEGENPAHQFLNITNAKTPENVLEQYVSFLLNESNISGFPVELTRIFQSFDMETPKAAPIGESRGMYSPENGIIFTNMDDRETVQRFTIAHELMEMLFEGYEVPVNWGSTKYQRQLTEDRKEKLCDLGAAKLLMPMEMFKPLVKDKGLSLRVGQGLASKCKTSLTATLRRMVKTDLEKCAFVIWKPMNKPSEFLPSQSKMQPLSENLKPKDPPEKLRVYHVTPSQSLDVFIPSKKSIDENNNIYQSYESNTQTKGYDKLDLGTTQGTFLTENLPFKVDEKRQVMTLIHFEKEVENETLKSLLQ